MLGGYQILDLRGIDLVIGTVASDITDSNVLYQLLKLRDYIDKAYNFSKPLENQLKPVLIRFRDKKANEKTEGAVFGELSVVDNYYSFKVTARISGALILTINVTFEEVANGYGNYEWVIDDATILLEDVIEALHGNISLDGDLDVSGDLSVGGDAEVTGDLSVTGSINGEENPSVKPIYCHPIHIENNNPSENRFHLTFLIFNQDNFAYDYATFKQWLASLFSEISPTEVQLLCSGGITTPNASKVIIASYLFYGSAGVGIAGITPTGVLDAIYTLNVADIDDIFGENISFKDAINKIN